MNLSAKSVENAKKQLEKAKKQLETEMLYDFLNTCCTFIVEQSKNYIMNSTIGDSVKMNIISGWQPPVIRQEGKKVIARITNTDSQAVYVEFGVGIVGKENPHERVSNGNVNYEYNMPSRYKKKDNSWIFSVSGDSDIDIQAEYIDNRTTNTVRTKGSPAVMYAFNACVDLEASQFRAIWETIKKRYWG